jgi:hypothetical protein
MGQDTERIGLHAWLPHARNSNGIRNETRIRSSHPEATADPVTTGRIATLGYSSRAEAALALRQQGFSTDCIAALLRIAPKAVIALEQSAGPLRARTDDSAMQLPAALLELLGPHAARRGIATDELARQIVETVVRERMVDAVLDDAEQVSALLDCAGRKPTRHGRVRRGDGPASTGF